METSDQASGAHEMRAMVDGDEAQGKMDARAGEGEEGKKLRP
jgi:hypothetical protein